MSYFSNDPSFLFVLGFVSFIFLALYSDHKHSPFHTFQRLPDLANTNTGHLVKFESQINNEERFSISILHVTSPRNCKTRTYTRNYSLLIWNSNLTGHLVFPLANLAITPDVLLTPNSSSDQTMKSCGQQVWVLQKNSTDSELQACLTPQQKIILDKTSCPNVFFGFSRMGPQAYSECQLPLRIKLSFKKKKKSNQTKSTLSVNQSHTNAPT